jgi:prepilin-type processing-associated H-X9-DG protein
MWGESAYALNKSVVSLKLSDIPGDVVLLFETTYGRTDSERDTPRKTRTYYDVPNYKNTRTVRFGKSLVYKDRWNQVGGPDILTTEYHKGRGCHVLFADGSVRFVKTKRLDTLRWEP